MKLYHGTSTNYLDSILRDGLKPRGLEKRGNWKTFPSRHDMVYLTVAYAAYFAMHCPGNPAIIEIETDGLATTRFHPDEDYVYERYEGRFKHKAVKRDLSKWKRLWGDSLKFMGNCCYQKAIRPSAMPRFVRWDYKQLPGVSRWAEFPRVSIKQYEVLGPKLAGLIAWLFGDEPKLPLDRSIVDSLRATGHHKEADGYIEDHKKASADRTSIEVETL